MVVRTETYSKRRAVRGARGGGRGARGRGAGMQSSRDIQGTEILGPTSPKAFSQATFTSEGAEGTEETRSVLLRQAERWPEGEAHGQED